MFRETIQQLRSLKAPARSGPAARCARSVPSRAYFAGVPGAWRPLSIPPMPVDRPAEWVWSERGKCLTNSGCCKDCNAVGTAIGSSRSDDRGCLVLCGPDSVGRCQTKHHESHTHPLVRVKARNGASPLEHTPSSIRVETGKEHIDREDTHPWIRVKTRNSASPLEHTHPSIRVKTKNGVPGQK